MHTALTKLQAGDKVMVYEDPTSRKTEEGEARLIKREQQLSDKYQRWSVHFDIDCPVSFSRIVHPIDKLHKAHYTKRAWVRDPNVPMGKLAKGRFNCECGNAPLTDYNKSQGDVLCNCGICYTWDGWIKAYPLKKEN